MENNDLKKYFDFASGLEKLKQLERFKGQYYWKDYPKLPRYESVADHTWRLGMLIIILADQLSAKIDVEKALKMVLIHDLPEIYAGDGSPLGDDGTGLNSYAFNQAEAEQRHQQEKNAAALVFEKLPPELAKNFFDLWLEYDLQENFEAKVVRSLDKLEALMQVSEYRQGNLFAEHLAFNIKYASEGLDIDPAIWQFGNFIIEEMKNNYKRFIK